ncbi:MAG: 4-(cytidine 5'-diphospho)-2-C-methyl-D-erythritol kinase [Planctomycetes bacterium]|nr:4-(cytidine 5'-diphospho)-2-C-methyl-D-erythritol kinase [Planctomycetota bacterium]
MLFESFDHGNSLRVQAPAKINLYLEILGLRPDNYHEIDTVLQAVSLYDTIEFRRRPGGEAVELAVEGQPALSGGADNLICRAALLLRERARILGRAGSCTGLSIRLEKRIPMGGGMGGGSSDAAAALLALNRLWKLSLPRQDLQPLAAVLGSDVAFFLEGGTARCTGRGEIVTPLADPLRRHYVLVTPAVEVPTAMIYQQLRQRRQQGIGLTASQAIATMNFKLFLESLMEGQKTSRSGEHREVSLAPWFNRLQEVAFDGFPSLRDVYQLLEEEPFIKVQLTGSGSTLFGVCVDQGMAEDLAARLKRRLEDRKLECQVFPVHSLAGW